MEEARAQTILLVEDEPLVAMAETMTLEMNGYTVITVGTGEEAIEIVRNGSAVDLVLMDIDLGPGMSGTDAATIILAERELPLVFLSSHTEPAVVEQTEGITSYGYIVKNCGETVLLASIRMAFRLYESRRLFADVVTHSINGVCVHRVIRDEKGEPFDCEYLQVNGAFEAHTGLSAPAVTGRTIRGIFPREEADDVIRLYADVLAGRADSRQELYFAAIESWFELSIFPTRKEEFAVVLSNITERKRIQESIAAHQRRLAEVNRIAVLANHELVLDRVLALILEETVTSLDASAGIVSLSDPDTQMLSWGASLGLSDEFVDQYRRTPARMGEGLAGTIAQTREPVFIPEDVSNDPRLARPMARREGLDSYIGVPILAADQVIGVMSILARAPRHLTEEDVPFCSAVGAQVGWAIVNARLHAEQVRAQEANRLFRTISDAAVFGSAIADTQGNLVYVNRSFARVHGYEPEDLIGRHLSFFHTPEQMEAVDRTVTHMIRHGYFEPVETWHLRRDGTEFPMLMSGVVINDANGAPHYIGASAVDITAIKRAEERAFDAHRRLEDALERAMTIMSAVPTAVLVFDPSEHIVDGNPAARRMFRSSSPLNGTARCGDYIRCRHCLEHREGCGDTAMCCDCEINAAIMQVLQGGPAVDDQEKEVEQADGERLWIRFSVVPLTLQDERCALFVAQDVSAHKEAESQIARQLAEKETLLKEVHHRVKNSIAGIRGLLTLQAASSGSEEVKTALDDAISRVRSMGELYEKLLLGDEYREVSIREYAEGLVASIREVHPASGRVAVETSIADFAIDTRTAVSVGIILNELVTNAFKYAFAGRDGGTLSVGIDRHASAVTITVRDDGVGLDPDRAPQTASGLGLTLVRMLAEQLGGTFTMETGLGTRSVVRFEL